MSRPCVTTPLVERHMVEQYAAGAGLSRIAAYFDCSETVVRRALRRQGVTLRPRGRVRAVELTPAALARYAPGDDLSALARSLDVARTSLRRALDRAGVYAPPHRRHRPVDNNENSP